MNGAATNYGETVIRDLAARLPALPLDVVDELRARVAGALEAWPDVEVTSSLFAEHLASRMAKNIADAAKLQIADLYLTCACLRGTTSALAHFREEYLAAVPKMLRTFPAGVVDEVVELLPEKLLVGPTAKLAEFSGRAHLRRWLKTVAINAARDIVRRREGPVLSDEELLIRAVEGVDLARPSDAEREVFRHATRDLLRSVIADALGRLAPNDRALLRAIFVERLTLAEAGRPYAADPSKMHRKLQRIYGALRSDIQQALEARLGLSATECDSVMRSMFSRVDIQISQLLAKNN